jgi:hypothetical protein
METNNSVNTILKMGIIIGIIGSLLCFLCVFLPNRIAYKQQPSNRKYFYNFIEEEYRNPFKQTDEQTDNQVTEEWNKEEHLYYENLMQIFDTWIG